MIPVLIIATVKGRRRPIASIQLLCGEPCCRMLQVIGRIMVCLKKNPEYVDRDLAYAETWTDGKWSWGARARKGSFVEVPEFPFVHTCLFFGAVSSGWGDHTLQRIASRPWNSAPDLGEKCMWEEGCAVIDLTDYSYAFVRLGCHPHGIASKETSPSLGFRLLDGHQWLTEFKKQHDNPEIDGVWVEGDDKPAPVTSIEALREAWPFFPSESNSDSADSESEDTEETNDGSIRTEYVRIEGDDEPDPVTSIEAWRESQPESMPSGSDNVSEDTEEMDNEEIEHKDVNTDEEALASQKKDSPASHREAMPKSRTEEAPVSRKRKREPESIDQRIWRTIEELLVSRSPRKLSVQKRNKAFQPLLKRYVEEHPEHFAVKHPGAVPLLLSAFTHGRSSISDLDLHLLQSLSGDQVVELVKGVVAHNGTIHGRATETLKMLDISFNASVTVEHVGRIVDVTNLDELLMWHNPGLRFEEIMMVADGRIRKVTTRAGFLAPLKRWVMQNAPTENNSTQPPPPTELRICQIVWMTLGTAKVDASAVRPDVHYSLRIPKGKLSLEEVGVDTVATLLHPEFYDMVYRKSCQPNIAFSQLVTMPYYDSSAPLREIYTSVARIERYMSNEYLTDMYCTSSIQRRLSVFPLLMATGNEQSEYVVSSPFPPMAFDFATRGMQSFSSSDVLPLTTHAPRRIMHEEYTLMFLREPDYGRLRYGLVTRGREGQLEVLDPGAAALAADDAEAALAWNRGVGALPKWRGEEEARQEQGEEVEKEKLYRQSRNTMQLDVAAVEKIYTAVRQLKRHGLDIRTRLNEIF